MDYTGFTAQDFLRDEHFQNWVLKPNTENENFWQNWLQEHPDRKAEVQKAREFILSLSFKPAVLPADKVSKIWCNIEANTTGAKVIPLFPDEEPVARKQTNLYRVAAVFICILFAGLALWKYQQAESPVIKIATGFGETRQITLPDNSKVVLNGNSTLSYAGNWSTTSAREVKLQGEAYFAVTHTQNHQQFKVHGAQGLQVEVLGTKFVVTSRPQKKRIVLDEGKVKVAVTRKEMFGLRTTPLAEEVMKPGEQVELGPAAQLYKSTVGSRNPYTAFLQNKIVFVDTPLSEVARVLEDTYGYKVTFTEPSLATRRFTGSSHPKKINMLLTAIEKSFSLSVVKKGRQITIKPA